MTGFTDFDAVPELSLKESRLFIGEVQRILPRASSLSESIEIWGSEEDIIVQRILPGETIRVRIHVGNYGPTTSAALDDLLSVARRQRLIVLLLDDLQIVEPNPSVVEYAMLASRAAKWVQNPSKYLRDLSMERKIPFG